MHQVLIKGRVRVRVSVTLTPNPIPHPNPNLSQAMQDLQIEQEKLQQVP